MYFLKKLFEKHFDNNENKDLKDNSSRVKKVIVEKDESNKSDEKQIKC